MEYNDYFPIEPSEDHVSMDEFVAGAMEDNLVFSDVESELSFMKAARITLKNEVLTCYEFLKEQNILSHYHFFRDGV